MPPRPVTRMRHSSKVVVFGILVPVHPHLDVCMNACTQRASRTSEQSPFWARQNHCGQVRCPKQFVAIYSNHPESKLHQPRTRANAHPRVLLHMRGERLQRRQQARQVRPMAPDWHVHAAGSPLSAPRHRQLNPAGASAAASCCRRSLLQLYARPASTGRSASTKDVVPFKRQPPVTKRHAPGSCSCCRGCVSPLLAAARAACAWPFAAASVTSAGCRPAASPRNGGARSVYSARLVKTEITNFIY